MAKVKKNNSKSIFFNNLFIYILLDVVLILFTIRFAYLYNFFDPIITPVRISTENFSYNLVTFFSALNNINSIEKKNINLEESIYKYKSLEFQLKLYQNENISLKKQLGYISTKSKNAYIYSQIMYFNNTFGYTYIDTGSSEGVQIGNPVIFKNYLVGIISRTYNNYSKVRLISNINTNIPVIVNKNNAILAGSLSSGLVLKDITQLDDVHVGDIVLTSGLNGTLPKNLIIGYISGINGPSSSLFKTVSVDSAININNINSVFVLKYE